MVGGQPNFAYQYDCVKFVFVLRCSESNLLPLREPRLQLYHSAKRDNSSKFKILYTPDFLFRVALPVHPAVTGYRDLRWKLNAAERRADHIAGPPPADNAQTHQRAGAGGPVVNTLGLEPKSLAFETRLSDGPS